MKKYKVTWVAKGYYTATVEGENFDAVQKTVEANFDSFFANKNAEEFDNEVYYEEITE